MKILFCGDVVGRAGRDIVLQKLPELRESMKLDLAVVNVDNAAAGFGVTPDICAEFLAAGADVLTGGDHIWDRKETFGFLEKEKRLLRPMNYPESLPGRGVYVHELADGRKIAILHTLGQVFLKDNPDCPFAAVDKALQPFRLGSNVDAILLDFHAEATSEKMAMGAYCDGRVSVVVGSHTHVPTADARVLPGGTAYQTDAGMCGDYDSVIGFEKSVPLETFTKKIRRQRLMPAMGQAALSGLYLETDDRTGLAKEVRIICSIQQPVYPIGKRYPRIEDGL